MNERELDLFNRIAYSLSQSECVEDVRWDLSLLFKLQNDIACRLMLTDNKLEGKHNMAREMMIAAMKEEL